MGTKKTYQDSTISINCELVPIQKSVINFFKSNQLSILTGDPGTAKTFLAMYHALNLLKDNAITKIIISRPIQEVGKSMGFLPGSKDEKIEEYTKSFRHACNKIMGLGKFEHLLKIGKIVFEPVNFSRGDNFEYCYVILDEAQGLPIHDLVTFVTRLSHTSKMIIMGDVYQADIKNSGLADLISISTGVGGTGLMELGDDYQMRSGLILEIYKNYKKFLAK
jgi:phosphate starvation-inducible PhoH-like protein